MKTHLLLKSIKLILFRSYRLGSRFSRPLCTRTYGSYNPSLSTDNTEVVDRLLSFFTKRPFYQDSEELMDLGPKLNTMIVEATLKGFKSWRMALMFFDWASTQVGYTHNCYAYNTMALILSRAHQNAPLRVLAMSLVNSRCSMSPGALGFFVRCLGGQGLVDEANMVFDQVKKMGFCVPNNYSYNCLLEAVSKSSSLDLLEMRLKEMGDLGWHADKYTLTPALQCYCNAGKFEKALDVFNQIYEHGWLDSHILSILAVSFSKWGRVDEAFDLIERMENHKIYLNEKTLRVLIHGFVKEGRVDKALQLFDKMQKLGFLPDISLYSVLIAGLCRYKECDKALHLYLHMNKLGVRPDVQLLTVLMSSLNGTKDTIELFKETKEYVDKESMILLYNSALTGLVNNGSCDKAYHLLRAMMGDECRGHPEADKIFMIEEIVCPDTTSFSIVIGGLCQTGELDKALSLFNDMDRMACKRSLLIYNNVIDGLSNSNRVEECYKLLAEMKELGFKPTPFTHNSIFACLCRREDVEGALDMVQEMRMHGHEPWIKYSTVLVRNLCRNGRAFEACNFLAKMVQEGFVPDIVSYSTAIYGFLKIQEVDQALGLFRDICARGCCPDVVAYNIIINGLCKAKRLSEAQDVLNEMLEKGRVPSVVTYNLLIDAWCKSGDIDRAVTCLSKMNGEKQEANVITYTTLIDGLCNAARPDDALLLWNRMVNKGCPPNKISFMALIHGLCKCGRPNEALIYFQEMEEKEMVPDAFIYAALIEASLSKSNAPLALDILRKMVRNEKIPHSLDKKNMSLRDAVSKLSEDARTCLDVRNLVADGSIPSTLNILDFEKVTVD